MIRFCVPALVAASLAFPLAAAESGQLDASPSVFSVLCAMQAAGLDTATSAADHPLRESVRKQLAARKIAVLPELRVFFSGHRQKDASAELSQYISFALAVEGPPDFKYRYKQHLLPPDVAALEGFDKLMAKFHSEAGIDELWRQAQPEFEKAIGKYHEPVVRAVTEVGAYLRHVSSGRFGRQFQVYLDLIGPPNQIQTRSYADDYFVLATASPEPQADDVRHAYLHFLLDPMATRNAEGLMKKRGLGDYALGSPLLEDFYKNDFLLLATESLIKAVESRLAPSSKRQAMVDQALREGFVLAPCFAELLPAYEKQEQSLRLYFPDLIQAIDLKKEERRLDKVEFARERAVRRAKVVPAERKVEPVGPRKTLADAEGLYRTRELDKAREAYLRLLRETDEKALHAKAYYGLARIAALQKDPELAMKLFEKTLELGPDPETLAWTHVYLGRLAALAGEDERASGHYRAALAGEGGSPAARQAAEEGLKGAFPTRK